MDDPEKPSICCYPRGRLDQACLERLTLPEMFDRSAGEFPHNMALSYMGHEMSFSELKDSVDRFAECLRDFGIGKGDSVAVLLPSTIQRVVAYYATLKIGGVAAVGSSPFWAENVEGLIDDSGARVLITLDDLADRMIGVRPRTGVKQIIVATLSDYIHVPWPETEVRQARYVYRWRDLMYLYGPVSANADLSFNDPAQYQYPGGAAGLLKGMVLTHGDLSRNAQQLTTWLPAWERGNEILVNTSIFSRISDMITAMNSAMCMSWGNVLLPGPGTDQRGRGRHASLIREKRWERDPGEEESAERES